MSAFYPGAGTDLVPPVLFPEIKTWFYMDSRPHGCCSRFLPELDKAMRAAGFNFQEADGNRLTYASGDQTIYYDTCSIFPDAWDRLLHANMKYNTLVVANHEVDKVLPVGFFSSYAHIITYSTTSRSWRDHLYDSHTISEITSHASEGVHHSVEKNIRCTHPVYTCRDRLGTPTLKRLFKLLRREALVSDSM